MAIILFDNAFRSQLSPFSTTKAVAAFRFGIFTIKERWEKLTGENVYVHTEKYLQNLYKIPADGEHTWVDASVMDDITALVKEMATGTCVADDKGLIAGKAAIQFNDFNPAESLLYFNKIGQHTLVQRLEYPWQMMQWNAEMIKKDFALVIQGRRSAAIPATVNTIASENIFVEEGATLNYCTINASAGPVYIGKNAEVMEGSTIRGPFVLGEHSVLKMNSRIYPATSLGPWCIGGGEIKNAVLMGYSNKGHDGYLGDAVIGEWCNLGAGTSNSNIKNTAGEIRMSVMESEYVSAGNKCGVMMGDYTRTAINSSINTGSLFGIGCNVFGCGLLPNVLPHFSWGIDGAQYDIEKAVQDISNWKKMKNEKVYPKERTLLEYIFASLQKQKLQ